MSQLFKASFLSCWLLFAGVIGCIFFSCGGLMAFGLAPSLEDRAAELNTLPTTPDVAVGQEAILTGTLSENETITTDPEISNIASYELVAYLVERYERSTSGTGSNRRTTGSWRIDRRVVDTLTLDVNGTLVDLIGDDLSTALNGTPHEFRVDGSNTLSNGSRRVRGFRNGDQVTIVGERTLNGSFETSEIYGGTREQLIENAETGAAVAKYLGLAFMGCSLVVMLIFGIVAAVVMLANRRRAQSEPEFPNPM